MSKNIDNIFVGILVGALLVTLVYSGYLTFQIMEKDANIKYLETRIDFLKVGIDTLCSIDNMQTKYINELNSEAIENNIILKEKPLNCEGLSELK